MECRRGGKGRHHGRGGANDGGVVVVTASVIPTFLDRLALLWRVSFHKVRSMESMVRGEDHLPLFSPSRFMYTSTRSPVERVKNELDFDCSILVGLRFAARVVALRRDQEE